MECTTTFTCVLGGICYFFLVTCCHLHSWGGCCNHSFNMYLFSWCCSHVLNSFRLHFFINLSEYLFTIFSMSMFRILFIKILTKSSMSLKTFKNVGFLKRLSMVMCISLIIMLRYKEIIVHWSQFQRSRFKGHTSKVSRIFLAQIFPLAIAL